MNPYNFVSHSMACKRIDMLQLMVENNFPNLVDWKETLNSMLHLEEGEAIDWLDPGLEKYLLTSLAPDLETVEAMRSVWEFNSAFWMIEQFLLEEEVEGENYKDEIEAITLLMVSGLSGLPMTFATNIDVFKYQIAKAVDNYKAELRSKGGLSKASNFSQQRAYIQKRYLEHYRLMIETSRMKRVNAAANLAVEVIELQKQNIAKKRLSEENLPKLIEKYMYRIDQGDNIA